MLFHSEVITLLILKDTIRYFSESIRGQKENNQLNIIRADILYARRQPPREKQVLAIAPPGDELCPWISHCAISIA